MSGDPFATLNALLDSGGGAKPTAEETFAAFSAGAPAGFGGPVPPPPTSAIPANGTGNLESLYEQFLAGAASIDASLHTAPSPPVPAREERYEPADLFVPSKAERRNLFHRMDVNGNGALSLAEIDKAVVELFPDFDHKPALMRAYKAADRKADGLIRRNEFRLLLKYLVYFNDLWDRFDEIDSDDDRRISLEEFKRGCGILGIGIPAEEIEADFDDMDANGGGTVLFEEFCSWCAQNHVIDDETEDDDNDGGSYGHRQPRGGSFEADSPNSSSMSSGRRGARKPRGPGGSPVSPNRTAQSKRAITRKKQVAGSEVVELLRTKLRGLSYDHRGQNPSKLFQLYDMDNSGSLDYAEFRAAVRKGGKVTEQMLSERDLEQLFDTVDTDYNGTISIDELTTFVWGAPGGPAAARATSGGSVAAAAGRVPDAMEALYEQFAMSAPAVDTGPGGGSPGAGGDVSPRSETRSETGPWGDGDRDLSVVGGGGSPGGLAGKGGPEVFSRLSSPGRQRGGYEGGSTRVRSLVSPPRGGRFATPRTGAEQSQRIRGLVSPPRSRGYLGTSGKVPAAKTVSHSSLRRLASPTRRQREQQEEELAGSGGAYRPEQSWWAKTGGDQRGAVRPSARPPWTANAKPPLNHNLVEVGEHASRRLGSPDRRLGSPNRRVGPSRTGSGGGGRKKRESTGGTRAGGSSGGAGHAELVSRLHSLHQQRAERLEALREEVERQRREKEEVACTS